MLDIKFVRDNPELVLQNLKNRNNPMNLDRFMELEKHVVKSLLKQKI